jgi:hypothetical protein
MASGKERMTRLRALRLGEGKRQVTVWLDPPSRSRLDALRRPGEHDSDVVQRALQALAREASGRQGVTSDTSPRPSAVTSDVTSDTAHPTDEQAQLIALWEQGLEVKAIAAQLGRTWTAVQSRIRRLEHKGLIQPRPRGGDYPSRRAQTRQRTDPPAAGRS